MPQNSIDNEYSTEEKEANVENEQTEEADDTEKTEENSEEEDSYDEDYEEEYNSWNGNQEKVVYKEEVKKTRINISRELKSRRTRKNIYRNITK